MNVILLNYDYTFLNKVSLKKALHYMAKGKVEVVKHSEDEVVRSFSEEYKSPIVIRLVYMIKCIYKRAVVWTKRNVMVRDNFTCVYCPEDRRSKLNIDHVIPRAKGGKNTFENTVCSCKKCNSYKGDMSLSEAGMHFIERGYRPYQPTIMEFLKKYHDSLGINQKLKDLGVY